MARAIAYARAVPLCPAGHTRHIFCLMRDMRYDAKHDVSFSGQVCQIERTIGLMRRYSAKGRFFTNILEMDSPGFPLCWISAYAEAGG